MAEHEGEHGLISVPHDALEDAAAHGERAGRRPHLHARLFLGQLAADEAQRPLGEAGGELAGAGPRVVDELVDDEIRLRAHREGGAVDQKHLHHAGVGRLDALVVDDGLADLQRLHGAARGFSRGLRRHRGGDTDALGGLSRKVGKSRKEQRGEGGSYARYDR